MVAMPTIFAIFPGSIPDFPQIEATLEKDYQFVLLDKVEALSKHKDEKGVVLLGGEPIRVAPMVGMLQSIAPRLGPVVVLDSKYQDQITSEITSLVDFLVLPLNPLEVRSRINRACHISELRHLVETTAMRDEVTELYHQQYFVKRLGEEISMAKRHLSPVTCAIISISYYDVYLDSYGYDFIVNMLHQLANISTDHVRQEDIVARLGNSEIGFLMPLSTEKGAVSMTKRLMDKIEAIPFYMGDQVEHLYLNAGIAGFPTSDPDEDVDADTLVRYARHALHTSRCSENNKIQLFSDLKPQLK